MTYALCALFVVVTVVHRFVVNMGQRFMSPHAAWRDALNCGKGAGILAIAIAALYSINHMAR